MSENVSIEWALLSALRQGGIEAVTHALERGVEPLDFGEQGSRVNRVFELMVEGADKGQLPSDAELKLRLGFRPKFVDAEFDLDQRIEDILTASLRIKLRDGVEDVPDRLQGDPIAVLDELEDLVSECKSKITRKPVMTTDNPDWVNEIIEEYERAKQLSEIGKLIGLSSPWPLYDEVSLGLQRKQVTGLVAKTKMGKTYIALKWLQHICENDLAPGESAFFVSPETGKEVINRRFVSIYKNLPEKLVQRGQLQGEKEMDFYEFLNNWKHEPEKRPKVHWFYHDDVSSLQDLIRQAKKHKPRVIFIDAFYFMADALPQRYHRAADHIKLQRLAEMIHRDLAQDCDLAVVVTHQLAGSKKGKWSLDFDSDDLAGSKAIGRSVSALLGLLATKEMKTEGRRLIRTLEARNFEGVDWSIYYDPNTMNFDEIGKWTDEDEDDE